MPSGMVLYPLILKQQVGCKRLSLAWAFETAKCTPNNTLPSNRPLLFRQDHTS